MINGKAKTLLICSIIFCILSSVVCGGMNFIFMILGDLALALGGTMSGILSIILISVMFSIVIVLNIVLVILSAISLKFTSGNGENIEKGKKIYIALTVLFFINAIIMISLMILTFSEILTLMIFAVGSIRLIKYKKPETNINIESHEQENKE